MRIEDIKDGTSLFFPSTVEDKVVKFTVTNYHKGEEDKLFSLRLTDERGSYFAEQWEEVEDKRKSPDHVDLFVPLDLENRFGYGGKLVFYFTENGAVTSLRDIKREK